MKTIRRWYGNIKWLLNRPPTCCVEAKEPFPCDYCGRNGLINVDDEVAVCSDCLKKALDMSLAKGVKNG